MHHTDGLPRRDSEYGGLLEGNGLEARLNEAYAADAFACLGSAVCL